MNDEHLQRKAEDLITEYHEKAKERGQEFAEVFHKALAGSFTIVNAFSGTPASLGEEGQKAVNVSASGLVGIILLECLSRFPVEEAKEQTIEVVKMVNELMQKINSLGEE